MKALRTKVCTYAIALLVGLGFSTATFAGSSDFSGIWIAGHAELNVVAVDGTHTVGDQDEVSQGSIGGFAPTAGYELGFNLPLGPVFFVTLGLADGGSGSAQLVKVNDNQNDADVALHASDPTWYYIAPSISIFDNSAVYFKLGQYEADLKAIGNVVGAPNNLQGDMWGIGTTSIADNGLFFKTEAGAIQFDRFEIIDIGGSGNGGSGTNTVEGNPLVGYGHVSVGYKF